VRLDAEGCLQYYSPEVNVVEGDSRHTFDEYKKNWIDYDKSIVTDKVIPIQEDYIVCSKDFVITTWLLKDEVYMKSGDRITINPITNTLVFKNFGGQWKVIYSHPSGNPIIQKAEQK
jgi:ketosteroid isomerase-like protein